MDIAQQFLKGGKGFLQIGNWRFGMHDTTQFVFSSRSMYTSVIFCSNGTVLKGPRNDVTLWDRENQQANVVFGTYYIQFGGAWRLSEIDSCHLSLSHLSTYTCIIWRVDGTFHEGPRKDYNGFMKLTHFSPISCGENFIQIGRWRISAIDNFHLSIGTQTLVSEIYRSDGTIHPGPRMDFRCEKDTLINLNY